MNVSQMYTIMDLSCLLRVRSRTVRGWIHDNQFEGAVNTGGGQRPIYHVPFSGLSAYLKRVALFKPARTMITHEAFFTVSDAQSQLRIGDRKVRGLIHAGSFGAQIINIGGDERPDYRIPFSGFKACLKEAALFGDNSVPMGEMFYTAAHADSQLRIGHRKVCALIQRRAFGQGIINLGSDQQPDYRIPFSGLHTYLEHLRINASSQPHNPSR